MWVGGGEGTRAEHKSCAAVAVKACIGTVAMRARTKTAMQVKSKGGRDASKKRISGAEEQPASLQRRQLKQRQPSGGFQATHRVERT